MGISSSAISLPALEAADPAWHAHALIIAISHYHHVRRLPRLADARAIAHALRDPTTCGYPADAVTALDDAAATRAGILAELDALARVAPDATVVIYFSGHAITNDDGESYLVPVDGRADTPEQLAATALASRALAERLAHIRARRVVVIVDAEPGISPAALTRLAAGPGRVVITAARGGEPCPDTRAGVFTEHLLAGLRGAAGRADGFVRVLDLYDHVHRNVLARAPTQRPGLYTAREDNFVIARARREPPALIALPERTSFAYDALVLHAADARDRTWAIDVAVRQLEQRGLRVCVDSRDFARDTAALGELERLVSTSRFTVPILTPRFTPRRFEDLQTVMALQLGIDDARARLLPIVRQPCAARKNVRTLVSLDLIHDAEVQPGLDRLVFSLRA